ncbi:antibiotic biosynthesis monooxygenase family protein [Marinomonas atlantica]|uniref:antibiotic biosynthesis monooxygenase family protein n=1 Tax=Marinomonas atlantica TaxID=1806668 RepID=UPI000829E0E7|nr:antibiotic biosynthesis monooxygenase [Marinomonas atlantica]MCO4785199.1 antibiotic biosynthesis monooxygenase [Marinomonas atlantica]
MIRVVYEWHVSPENIAEFCDAWKSTTQIVRETHPGAHGSCLLEEDNKPSYFLAIARWNSREEWRDFWSTDNPPEVIRMSTLGKLISIKTYDEIGNHTF